MEHNISMITTLTAAFGFALVLGFAAERLKMLALVGYLLTQIGEFPSFWADWDCRLACCRQKA